MLPVKLVRSLVLGETINNPFHHHDHHHHDDSDDERKPKTRSLTSITNQNKIPMLLFIPNNELITDTFRLASLARDLGMHFHPSPSLSHLIFSWPPSSPPSSSPSTTMTSSSSSSSSKRSDLLNEGAPLPFPSLSTPTASLSLLRFFVSLSRGLFKLVFFDAGPGWPGHGPERGGLRLYCRVSGCRVRSMDEMCREMAGHGWALFRTHRVENEVYVFQKRECNRVRVRVGPGSGECCRVRELRLPLLDFRNGVDLKILLYILLMTDDDDIFYLA